MKIPVVLSVVHVAIDADGVLAVDVDGVPRDSEQSRTRGDLRAVLDEITADLGAPVRVEVREADGIDVRRHRDSPGIPGTSGGGAVTHHRQLRRSLVPGSSRARRSRSPTSSHARTPTPTGNASLNLPPALLAATRGGLVLLGMTSRTVTPFEAPA